MAVTRLCEESRWLPGRLLILHNNHMNRDDIDNYPVPCECGKHTYQREIPRGFIHPLSDPCPFKDDGFPVGVLQRCCWLYGQAVMVHLAELGERALSEHMYE